MTDLELFRKLKEYLLNPLNQFSFTFIEMPKGEGVYRFDENEGIVLNYEQIEKIKVHHLRDILNRIEKALEVNNEENK